MTLFGHHLLFLGICDADQKHMGSKAQSQLGMTGKWQSLEASDSQPLGLKPLGGGVKKLFHRGCLSDILHIRYLRHNS